MKRDASRKPGPVRSGRGHLTTPHRRPRLRAALAVGLMGWALTAHAADCVREEQSVRISGHVQRQRMTRVVEERSGASRAQRDLVISMVLREPLCVMLPDDVTLAMRPRRIKEVQLLNADRLPTGHDQGVLVDGRVVLATSSAHHLPVLVEVTGIPSARNSAPTTPSGNASTTLAAARVVR